MHFHALASTDRVCEERFFFVHQDMAMHDNELLLQSIFASGSDIEALGIAIASSRSNRLNQRSDNERYPLWIVTATEHDDALIHGWHKGTRNTVRV